MKIRRVLLFIAGVLCLGLLGMAFSSWQMRGELRREQAAALQRKVALQAELRRVAQTTAGGATGAQMEPQSPTGPAVPATPPPPAPRPLSRTPGTIDLARDNPGFWNEFIALKKAESGQYYGPLLQRLGLSPEQRTRFKELMSAGMARSVDISAAADAKMIPLDDPTVVALRKKSETQTEAEIAALLGESGLAAYKEYHRSVQVRGLAAGLAVQFLRVEPLTGEQAERLTQALAQASPAYRQGGNATMGDVEWARADEQAQTILTPRQFEIWQEGTAHNVYGGSRREAEFKKIYEEAVKAATGREPAIKD